MPLADFRQFKRGAEVLQNIEALKTAKEETEKHIEKIQKDIKVSGLITAEDKKKLEDIASMTADEIERGTDTNGRLISAKILADYVIGAIAKLVESAPETLDTLGELAKALGNDSNFATTISTEIGKKLDATAKAVSAAKADQVPFTGVTGLPTTLVGYGITDAPTKTGTGASGTWGINVSGKAATADTPADNDSSTKIATTAWVQNFCNTTKKFLTAHQSLSNYLTKTTNVSEMGRYIDMHFDNATSKYDYDVRLQVNNQGTAAGGGQLQIVGASVKASKFEGPLVGNVTGNCSGSSGSCTGTAATATKAIGDKNGNDITTTYLPLTGGVCTGKITAVGFRDKRTHYDIVNGYTPAADSGTHYWGIAYADKNDKLVFDNLYWVNNKGSGGRGMAIRIYNPDGNCSAPFTVGRHENDTEYVHVLQPADNSNSDDAATTKWVRTTVPTLNSATATKLKTARTINIQDSSATNTGTGASFDGSGNATIKLPATIKANITGDCSGSSGSCTGNSATATTLKTARAINGVSFNGGAAVSIGTVCTTAAATVEKVVSLANYALTNYSTITVLFKYKNTATNPTLNVNNTGAKPIKYKNAAVATGFTSANWVPVTLMYYSDAWHITNGSNVTS